MEKVTEATLHLEKVTEAMAKCNLSLEYLKVTEAMAKCNLSLKYSQKIFWSDWTYEFNVLDCGTARAVNIHENGYTKCDLELNHEWLSFSEFSLPLLYELLH